MHLVPHACGHANPEDATRCRGCGERLLEPAAALDPPTARLSADAAELAVAWLCCDPHPPIPLASGVELSIGRQSDCDLVLRHHGVSRRHAVVRVSLEGAVTVEDCSSNGTFLNGKRVRQASLRSLDELAIGPYDLELRDRRPDPDLLEGTQPLDVTAVATGLIDEVPLAETLREIEFNRSSGVLTVVSGELRGRVELREGRPQRVTLGDLRDEQALLALLDLRDGRFTFSAGAALSGDPTFSGTITGALLEHSRRADETRHTQRLARE